ncbi:putative protein phosphatase 2C 12, partial [Camellia lanceoleosa]
LFDGHNGPAAAIYSKENLLNNLLACIPSDLNRDEWIAAPPRALVAGFVKTDKDFQERAQTSGTTVTFMIIEGWFITVASIGDSRCVLESADGEIYYLSADHRLECSAEERERITASGEFPEEMKHPIHTHSLTLQHSGSSRRCDVCEDISRGFSYRCSPCNFDVDIRCTVRGQHFSSKHQLMILNEDEKNDVDERVSCDVCLQQITGSAAAYKCTNCCLSIYLHKLCAEQPAEMEHPMHPDHPLALLQVKANEFSCDGCDIGLKEFIYRCSICNFNLDRRCALRAHKDADIAFMSIAQERQSMLSH